jgi:hypothetical protein
MHSRADFAADLEIRALALDAIDKRVASRARLRADDQASAGGRQHHAARPGCRPECDGHHDGTRWQLGPNAGAPALGSDLSGEGRDERVNRQWGPDMPLF